MMKDVSLRGFSQAASAIRKVWPVVWRLPDPRMWKGLRILLPEAAGEIFPGGWGLFEKIVDWGEL